MFRYDKRGGFTLVEILVVISIVGIISVLAMVNFVNVKLNARDNARITDLANILKALELYYDTNDYYPAPPGGYDVISSARSYNSSWDDLAVELEPWLKPLPVDPINSNCDTETNNCHSYSYGNVGRYAYPAQYDLYANFENENHKLSCGVTNWKFYFDNRPWCKAWGGDASNELYEASFD